VLTAEEFGGKTAGEADVKKKIRTEYPELAGVQFGLVKFNNSCTEQYEKINGVFLAETGDGNTGEKVSGEKPAEMPLDFAAAQEDVL